MSSLSPRCLGALACSGLAALAVALLPAAASAATPSASHPALTDFVPQGGLLFVSFPKK